MHSLITLPLDIIGRLCSMTVALSKKILYFFFFKKKGKRKVQGVPQSQAAALPDTNRKRKQTKPYKRKSNKRTKSTKISSLPQAR